MRKKLDDLQHAEFIVAERSTELLALRQEHVEKVKKESRGHYQGLEYTKLGEWCWAGDCSHEIFQFLFEVA